MGDVVFFSSDDVIVSLITNWFGVHKSTEACVCVLHKV